MYVVMRLEVLNCASKTTLELFRGAVVVAFGAETVCFMKALWPGKRGWVLATCYDAVRCVAVVTALLMRCVLVRLSCIRNQLCKKSVDVNPFHLQQNDVQRESGGNKER